MLSGVYWLAACCALIGGCFGNRIAWPLLASAGFCFVARWQEWPFDLTLWVTVDVLVLIGVFTVLVNESLKPDWHLTWREVAVVLLFAPALAAYALPDDPAHVLSTLTGAAQLLLASPFRRAWGRTRQINERFDPWDHFNLKVAHEAAA